MVYQYVSLMILFLNSWESYQNYKNSKVFRIPKYNVILKQLVLIFCVEKIENYNRDMFLQYAHLIQMNSIFL